MAIFNMQKVDRKRSILTFFAIRIEKGDNSHATMYDIARGIGLKPSSHITKILDEMLNDNQLTAMPYLKSGRWEGKAYFLTNVKNIKKTEREITINSSRGKLRLRL